MMIDPKARRVLREIQTDLATLRARLDRIEREVVGVAAEPAPPPATVIRQANVADMVDLDDIETAIDWYEAQAEGKPVMPREGEAGVTIYLVGGKAHTRGELLRIVNALRAERGEPAFFIGGGAS